MIKNILNVNGVKALTKKKQFTVAGGAFINCKRFQVNGNWYAECYDTVKEEYVIYNYMGGISDCDELFDH